MVIRMDRGTENVLVASAQYAMRCGHHDSHAGDQSFKYGRSQSNIVNYHPRTNCNTNHTQSCCPAEN